MPSAWLECSRNMADLWLRPSSWRVWRESRQIEHEPRNLGGGPSYATGAAVSPAVRSLCGAQTCPGPVRRDSWRAVARPTANLLQGAVFWPLLVAHSGVVSSNACRMALTDVVTNPLQVVSRGGCPNWTRVCDAKVGAV